MRELVQICQEVCGRREVLSSERNEKLENDKNLVVVYNKNDMEEVIYMGCGVCAPKKPKKKAKKKNRR